jgi:hypothetical protein
MAFAVGVEPDCHDVCDTRLCRHLLHLKGLKGCSLLFCEESPTAACVAGNGGVRSLRDNVSFLLCCERPSCETFHSVTGAAEA